MERVARLKKWKWLELGEIWVRGIGDRKRFRRRDAETQRATRFPTVVKGRGRIFSNFLGSFRKESFFLPGSPGAAKGLAARLGGASQHRCLPVAALNLFNTFLGSFRSRVFFFPISEMGSDGSGGFNLFFGLHIQSDYGPRCKSPELRNWEVLGIP